MNRGGGKGKLIVWGPQTTGKMSWQDRQGTQWDLVNRGSHSSPDSSVPGAAVLCTGQVCGSFISLTDKPAEAPGGRGWHEVRQLLCG